MGLRGDHQGCQLIMTTGAGVCGWSNMNARRAHQPREDQPRLPPQRTKPFIPHGGGGPGVGPIGVAEQPCPLPGHAHEAIEGEEERWCGSLWIGID